MVRKGNKMDRTDYTKNFDDYVSTEEEIPSVVSEPEIDEKPNDFIGIVKCKENQVLNVRSEADKDSEPVTTVKKDAELLIISGVNEHGDWYKVCTAAGNEGFVLKEFVEIV